jgi:hypothetical protein
VLLLLLLWALLLAGLAGDPLPPVLTGCQL